MSHPMMTKNHIIILTVLTLGSFCTGMAEFFTIWLSPTIAQELHTSAVNVSTAASYYAFGVLLGIPILTPLIKHMSHQRMLALLLFWCFLGNIATSFVHSWEQLRWIRIFAGLPHGMFLGIASMVLMQILPQHKHGLGIGILMSGIGLALILVVPMSIYLEKFQDWRIIVRAVGLMDLLIMVLLHDLLNEAPPPPDSRPPLAITHTLKNPLLWWVFAIGITAFCGRMAIFAYSEAILIQITHFLDKQHLPFLIIASGIGTFIGFIVGGICADKSIKKTIIGALLYGIVSVTALHWMASRAFSLYLSFVLLGAHTVLLPPLQLLVIRSSSLAPTLASCLNHGALNLGNALGPLLASYVIFMGLGLMSITWIGTIGGILALLIFYLGCNKALPFMSANAPKP